MNVCSISCWKSAGPTLNVQVHMLMETTQLRRRFHRFLDSHPTSQPRQHRLLPRLLSRFLKQIYRRGTSATRILVLSEIHFPQAPMRETERKKQESEWNSFALGWSHNPTKSRSFGSLFFFFGWFLVHGSLVPFLSCGVKSKEGRVPISGRHPGASWGSSASAMHGSVGLL